uniref:Uncharacterized protein n=1 Tax=Anguilla anguilla TaxID=7936 RepID=A0A0E9SXN7_ANGAN
MCKSIIFSLHISKPLYEPINSVVKESIHA